MVEKLFRDNPILVGNRIKSARMLAGYSRKALAQKTNISMSTLRTWEDPGRGRHGITKNGAEKLAVLLGQVNVFCSSEWILRGKGESPRLLTDDERLFEKNFVVGWGEEERIFQDVESFKKNNPNSSVVMVTDDVMLPFYRHGDFVGGVFEEGKKLVALVGLNCIIKTEKEIYIRKIALANSDGSFILTGYNTQMPDAELIQPNIHIQKAAEIIWFRRRSSVF